MSGQRWPGPAQGHRSGRPHRDDAVRLGGAGNSGVALTTQSETNRPESV
jgi:hypothetical protein